MPPHRRRQRRRRIWALAIGWCWSRVSSWSTPGAWWCRRSCPAPTTSPTPMAQVEPACRLRQAASTSTASGRHPPGHRPSLLGVKGSRVQISPARQVDIGLSHLIRAAFIRPPAHPRQPQRREVEAQIRPTSASTPPRHRARLGMRVKITARHRRVLMAGHVLDKVQLDAGVGYRGTR